MQQLAGLLADISRHETEQAMLEAATHRMAEAVDAEVCALVSDTGEVPVAIGFPAGAEPARDLASIAEAGSGKLAVDGLGTVEAVVVALGSRPDGHAVVARSSSPLDADEVHLLRSMAQVIDLALQLRRTANRERELRLCTEAQAAELQRANNALLEASEAKDLFIAVASHELRTPLTSILGFAGTLRKHHAQVSAQQRESYLEVIERQGNRLLRLVDDLLTVGRIDSGGIEPSAEDTRVVARLEHVVEGHHTDVTVTGNPQLTAWVDPDHLDQIVANLLTNAEKYGREPIALYVDAVDDHVEVTVEDAGDGVPAAFVPRLFDRFSQASTGDHRDGAGAGLGLAIVTGLCEANGGDIRHERTDDLTRFIVRLPCRGRGDRA